MILRLMNNAVRSGESPLDVVAKFFQEVQLAAGDATLSIPEFRQDCDVSYVFLKRGSLASGSIVVSKDLPADDAIVDVLVFGRANRVLQ